MFDISKCSRPGCENERFIMAHGKPVCREHSEEYLKIQSGCPHCGLIHQTTCQRIKAMEYNPDDSVKRIEFHEPQPFTGAIGNRYYGPALGAGTVLDRDGVAAEKPMVVNLETLTADFLRREAIAKTLRRFEGWSTSIQPGGVSAEKRAEVREEFSDETPL